MKMLEISSIRGAVFTRTREPAFYGSLTDFIVERDQSSLLALEKEDTLLPICAKLMGATTGQREEGTIRREWPSSI